MYDGDPALIFAGNGIDIDIIEGQPIMTTGLDNALTLSIFGGADWWGNELCDDAEKISCEIDMRQTLTNTARLNILAATRKSLEWLKKTGAAKEYKVNAEIPGPGRLNLALEIQEPTGQNVQRKWALTWDSMRGRA